MLHAAITFFVLALVAFVLGATGCISMEIGKTLLFVFLALALVSYNASHGFLEGPKSLP